MINQKILWSLKTTAFQIQLGEATVDLKGRASMFP